MVDFGIVTIPTHYSLQPAELGRWAEAHGFESLWFGEHSHIPTSRKTPFPMGGELPEYYKQFFDPFIGLTAAAAATEKLKAGSLSRTRTQHHESGQDGRLPRSRVQRAIPLRHRRGMECRGNGRSWR